MGLSIPFAIIFKEMLKIFIYSIDNGILCMVICRHMNDVQARIARLEEKGWTLAALADDDELGVAHITVEKWKTGDRYPRPDKPILDALDRIAKRKRIPKKRRYLKGKLSYEKQR